MLHEVFRRNPEPNSSRPAFADLIHSEGMTRHRRARRRSFQFGERTRRIRGGEFDGEREAVLLRHLCATALDTALNKVRIASPREAV